MASDPERQRLVDNTVHVDEVNVEVVDRRDEGRMQFRRLGQPPGRYNTGPMDVPKVIAVRGKVLRWLYRMAGTMAGLVDSL